MTATGPGVRGLLALPVRRPVAVSMFFLALVLLGLAGWRSIPVELMPALEGDQIFVNFSRPGSEPELVERELLMPLEARASRLGGLAESWGEIRGQEGSLRLRFEPGTDLGVRELELERLASELVRDQPQGTTADVSGQDLGAISRFVMVVQVAGLEDHNALRDVVTERIQPRFEAIPGVSQVIVAGGAPRELTVAIDDRRCAALGVRTDQVTQALAAAVGRLRPLGALEDERGRTAVVLDPRPRGLQSLGEIAVEAGGRVRLRHVAEISLGVGEIDTLLRINGQPAVGLVIFQEEGANLIRLGRALRERIDELNGELETLGLSLVVGVDGARLVEDQLERLARLGASGFAIALVVLFLFIRQLRAVAVVGLAVPVSLLAALALLFVGGQSLNLVTLFGLAIGIGMLVDNSIVVYEAVQRMLERGHDADAAAVGGIRRTLRAILTASATNAVVFLPVLTTDLADTVTRNLLEVMAVAILLPIAASVLVAAGLVPLLARRFATPAARELLARRRHERRRLAGLSPPDRGREVFGGILEVALRRPIPWFFGVAAAILLTVLIALPWVLVSTFGQEAGEATEVTLEVGVPAGSRLETNAEAFEVLERAVLELEGVDSIESFVREEGGTITVRLLDKAERPPETTAGRVRQVLRLASRDLPGVEVRPPGSGSGNTGGGGLGLLGSAPTEVVLSGPDSRRLIDLGEELVARLQSIDDIGSATLANRAGLEQIQVHPLERELDAYGLGAQDVLPALVAVRREGVLLSTPYTLDQGREIPLTVRRVEGRGEGGPLRRAVTELEALPLATTAGNLRLGAVAEVRRRPAAATIVHHNGRREISLSYSLAADAPQSGPARVALDNRLREALRAVHLPSGYVLATPSEGETASWFERVLVPVVVLLYIVLAISFESLVMPLLVLLALPLTLLGAVWALALAGSGLELMALVGVVALLGLTVNPAILLVDRMQQRVRSGFWSAGAAALAAVKERTRPVLMTTATTIAGLWPLALSTGRENEIWPPFAIVVMGGLVTSTVLTLLVIPVAFVIARRLDELFGRLGPWVVLGWIVTTGAVVWPLIHFGVLESLLWQIVCSLLIGAAVLGVAAFWLWRDEPPEPQRVDGKPPQLSVRVLTKTYGQAGPVGAAWRSPERFAERVLARGGVPFDPSRPRRHRLTWLILAGAAFYLSLAVTTRLWEIVFLFLSALLLGAAVDAHQALSGRIDALGRVLPGGLGGAIKASFPWLAIAWLGWRHVVRPDLFDERRALEWWTLGLLAVLVLALQIGRSTARGVVSGRLPLRPDGRFAGFRERWRRVCRAALGFDLPVRETHALRAVSFEATEGMIGILGPNGAGKTTLLRQLAGILEPSAGRILLGNVYLDRLRRHLARWIGYLPQDFGLPDQLSAREYLDYFATLYEVPSTERADRVDRLLREVGLSDRADEPIGNFSGGMRQRVAVARTLLRLPSVIIVDEPTVGLDPKERIRFRNLLARLAAERIVLFSTHVVEDVAVACDRVLVMSEGRLVFDDPPASLAEAAAGKIWTAELAPDEERGLRSEASVIDRLPLDDGRARVRIYSDVEPHPRAEAVVPSLEDGYLALTADEMVVRAVA